MIYTIPEPLPPVDGRTSATFERYADARYVAIGSIAPPLRKRAISKIGLTSVVKAFFSVLLAMVSTEKATKCSALLT